MYVSFQKNEKYLENNGIKPEPGLSEKLSVMSMESGASYLKKQYRLDKTEEEIVEEILQMISDFYRFYSQVLPLYFFGGGVRDRTAVQK